MARKRIQIFRAGRHTSSDGRTMQFSTADLDAIVASYDPKAHEAPLVVGHPKEDAPAYGHVQALVRDGDVLCLDTDQVRALNTEFAEGCVNSGAYDKVSASLYLPDAAGNPKPGSYYLRHVGFLGATPPAIKGLAPAQFKEGEEGTVEFADWNDRYLVRLLRGMRDWMIGKFGQEEADKALPGWDVNYLQEEAAKEEDKPAALFSEAESKVTEAPVLEEPPPSERTLPGTPSAIAATVTIEPSAKPPAPDATDDAAAREAELKKREEEVAKREAAAAAREVEQRAAGHKDFCESLVKSGRPLPVPVDQVVSFLCALDGDSVSFGETDTRSMSTRLREDYLAKLPVSVDFRELAPAEDDESDGDGDEAKAARRAKEIVEYREQQAKAGVVVTTAQAAAATDRTKRSK